MHARKPVLPWREREFVTVAEAAAIAGRSTTWVRNQFVVGALDERRLPTGGPTVVTVASLARLVDGARPVEPIAPGPRRQAALRIVVDNARPAA